MALPQDAQSKVLVTGGAGFVGSHICEQLLRNGKQVILVDSLNSETTSQQEKLTTVGYLESVSQGIPESQLSVRIGDILDEPLMSQILADEEPTVCIHAASLVMDRRSVLAPDEFIQVNVLGTQRLLSAMAKTDTVEHLVYISSRSAIGETLAANDLMTENDSLRPINPYGASKAAAEAFCYSHHHNTGLSVSVCRFEPIYGPHGRPDMLPRRLLEAIHAGRQIKLYGNGSAVRDWLFITDAVEGILAASGHPLGFSIYHFGTGVGTTVNELVGLAEEVVGRKAVTVNVAVPPGDAHFGGLCDYSEAKRVLNWEPSVDLRQGFIKTYESMQREYGRSEFPNKIVHPNSAL